MKQKISIFWFRSDLRLSDNPGLVEASKLGQVFPIYILDNLSPSEFKIGKASQIYLHHSLEKLNDSLDDNLNLYIGNPEEIIFQLIEKYKIQNIFCSKCYEPAQISNDEKLQKKLDVANINYQSFNASYLWEPDLVMKEDGSYYKVFSAFKRKAYFFEPRKPISKPRDLVLFKDNENKTKLDDLRLKNKHPWEEKIEKYWTFGEKAAQEKLKHFVKNLLSGYKKNRDYPSYDHTSKLSANLHLGEISPNQIWEAIHVASRLNSFDENDLSHFLSELIWREFSNYLMFHFKKLPTDNFQSKFDSFSWSYNEELFNAWKAGKTGYPIVDAGMRELYGTGYMHNRVRMIAASFLVKNLMIHWHHGMDWFWDHLVDADLANNSANWQWVAGSGADAAPYFRIFNPMLQGEKFDMNGQYTKKFLPELAKLPNKYLFKPWEAPQEILQDCGIILGQNYPKPIVDLKFSRDRALFFYKKMNQDLAQE